MDMNRELRFLIPPIVAFTSLFWSLVIDKAFCVTAYLGELNKLTGESGDWLVIAGGGAAVLAAGYLISAPSLFILNLSDRRRRRSYEADLSKETLGALARDLSVDAPKSTEQEICLANYYVHGLVPKHHPGLLDWCSRRWNHFMVSTHVVFALALSLLGGMVVQYRFHRWPFSWRLFWWWVLPSILLMIILGSNALRAYKQVWAMVEFSARVGPKADERG